MISHLLPRLTLLLKHLRCSKEFIRPKDIGLSMYQFITNYLLCSLNRFAGSESGSQSAYRMRSAKSRRSKARRPECGTVTYESFEPRRLLANVSFTASTGEIVIGGSNAVDTARVVQASNVVTVTHQGEAHTFAASDLSLIHI